MLLQKSLIAVLTFLTTLAVVRLMGKKQLGELTYWDLVSAIALGALASDIVTGRGQLWMGLWMLALWGLLTFMIGWVAFNSATFRDIVLGRPLVLIRDGKILEDSMGKERYSTNMLLSQLREQGVFRVSDVEFAFLEPTGNLSVELKPENRPLTPKDLGLKVPSGGPTERLIVDGEIQEQTLARLGKNKQWLVAALAEHGVVDPEEVFYAELHHDDTLYVDRKQDHSY